MESKGCDLVLKSIEKTGRIAIVSEACERGSFAQTLAANITLFAFDSLVAAPQVLGAPNWIVPGAEMESTYFVQAADIVDVATQCFYPQLGAKRQGTRAGNAQERASRGI